RPEEYQFRLAGDAVAWNAQLFEAGLGRPIAGAVRSTELKEGVWHTPGSGHTPGFGMILLAVQPPDGATAGAVNVHLRQRSTDRGAVVEFTMDARASGRGCYKLCPWPGREPPRLARGASRPRRPLDVYRPESWLVRPNVPASPGWQCRALG